MSWSRAEGVLKCDGIAAFNGLLPVPCLAGIRATKADTARRKAREQGWRNYGSTGVGDRCPLHQPTRSKPDRRKAIK